MDGEDASSDGVDLTLGVLLRAQSVSVRNP